VSSQSHNTAARPSDAYPECPTCETNLLVDATDYESGQYYCHGCGDGFHAPDGYTPPEHEVNP